MHSLPSLQIRLVEPCVAGVKQKLYETRWVSIPSDGRRKAFERHMAFKAVVMDGLGRVHSEVGGFRRGLPSSIHASRMTLQDIADNNTDGRVVRTMDGCTGCCTSCEVWTVIPNSAAHRNVFLFLTFNSKVKVRCMRHGYPPLGLRAHDRLEPSPQMADVMQFESLTEYLVIVLFWRSLEHPGASPSPTALRRDRNKY